MLQIGTAVSSGCEKKYQCHQEGKKVQVDEERSPETGQRQKQQWYGKGSIPQGGGAADHPESRHHDGRRSQSDDPETEKTLPRRNERDPRPTVI